MNYLSRFWLLLLLVLLAVTPALAQQGDANTVTLKLKWQHQFQFAGFYADVNLDLIIEAPKRAEEKLKLSGREFNQAHEGILFTDARGLIVNINPAFAEITGCSRVDVIGREPSLLK